MHVTSFIVPTLQKTNHAIRRALLWGSVRLANPRRIIIGAGITRHPGWIPTDIDLLNILNKSDWERYFNPGSIDAILAEHVWEHLASDQALKATENCFTYLKHGGYIRVAVPDGYNPDPNYREYAKPGGYGPGATDHKVFYMYQTLSDLFSRVGFKVTLLEYFDERGTFNEISWKPVDGMISRSRHYDSRNINGQIRYTSLILDARK